MRQIAKVAAVLLVGGCLAACSDNGSDDAPAASGQTYYTTKTPYQPKQDAASYQAAPSGFTPVYTEIAARHGSRGLSGLKYDAALYNIWQKAASDGALTTVGASLGPDILKLMKANALLGYGVAGISKPGYGNLTQIGIDEHRQLAARLLQRLPSLFSGLASGTSRQLLFVSSGVDRAVDSAAFFSQSLATNAPALQSLIVQTPALTAYPADAPVAQAAGVNHFLLYFHALAAKTDLVTNNTDPYYATYQASLAYQAYQNDAELAAKLDQVAADPEIKTAARTAMERLFTKAFVDRIDDGTYSFANTGTYSYTSDDGKFTNTLTGDGKTKVKTVVDAALMLYNLYIIGPAMQNEVAVDLTQYLPDEEAKVFAYVQDAQDFYQKGPGIAENDSANFKMAQILEDDFFNEVDAIERGDLSHAAKLRFTHAEIMIPLAALLGLKDESTAIPKADTYTYDNNGWRGATVSPYAANIQWDVFRDGSGHLLVRMLQNEKETDFKAGCDGARETSGSHFYDYDKLKACYGHVAANT